MFHLVHHVPNHNCLSHFGEIFLILSLNALSSLTNVAKLSIAFHNVPFEYLVGFLVFNSLTEVDSKLTISHFSTAGNSISLFSFSVNL